jgi:hypothetical protein
VLLEAHRLAVTVLLLGIVFGSLMLFSNAWTVEMQRLLTETSTVQTILNTLLSGIILLVSIVVSINSIVLSHDITAVETQKNRIEGALAFRRELDALTDTGEHFSHPSSFLSVMSHVIDERARAISESETDPGDFDETERPELDVSQELQELAESVADATEHLEPDGRGTDAEFGVLWKGLEFDYGPFVDRLRTIRSSYEGTLSESIQERLDRLREAFELFAVGKEYFKTLYYAQEVSRLSRTLLVVALPAILINATTILAIDAGLLPDIWLFGLPPLHVFVAAAFTISLAPYLLLTSYMLRLATVANRTATGGIFSLRQ